MRAQKRSFIEELSNEIHRAERPAEPDRDSGLSEGRVATLVSRGGVISSARVYWRRPERGSRLRILVVDDEQAVVDGLCALIEDLGHKAVGVTSGYEALDRFGRDRFDLSIVDVVMPEMNGLEVMRRLRIIDPSARIVALTGTGLDFTDVLPALGIRFVRKPIGTRDDIVDLIAVR
jgi:CheY-like chemotaxis protein